MKLNASVQCASFALSLAAVCPIANGIEIDLLDAPGPNGQLIMSLPSDSVEFDLKSPVLDEDLANEGWFTLTILHERTAYCPDEKIGKDLYPVDNAILYSRPDAAASVVTTYQFGDSLEIIDSGIWWEVRIEKLMPLYFQENVAIAQDPPALVPKEEAVVVAPLYDDLPPATTVVEPSPAYVEDSQALNSGENLQDQPVFGGSMAPQTEGDIAQSFQGTFAKAKKRFGFIAPKHTFALFDAEGRRIAWVNVDSVVIPGNLSAYIGKEVVIYGQKSYDKQAKEWQIIAKNMRLK